MTLVDPSVLTIVTGLPRSGTSVMMQLLTAGGIEPMTDEVRSADEDNPRGYFELEAVKQTPKDASWLDAAGGKVVKMVHNLLVHLPLNRDYRVIFMRRNLDEVLASQRKMLDRHGRKGAALPDAQLKSIYAAQMEQTLRWLAGKPNFSVLQVDHGRLIADPPTIVRQIADFLARPLNREAMAAAVDPSLYRNRSGV